MIMWHLWYMIMWVCARPRLPSSRSKAAEVRQGGPCLLRTLGGLVFEPLQPLRFRRLFTRYQEAAAGMLIGSTAMTQ